MNTNPIINKVHGQYAALSLVAGYLFGRTAKGEQSSWDKVILGAWPYLLDRGTGASYLSYLLLISKQRQARLEFELVQTKGFVSRLPAIQVYFEQLKQIGAEPEEVRNTIYHQLLSALAGDQEPTKSTRDGKDGTCGTSCTPITDNKPSA